jgi:hypothetical protein
VQHVYLNTQAAYQKSYASYVTGADQAIADLGPDATLDQKRARLSTYSSEFVVTKLPGARAEMLEASGLLRNMQSYNNQLIAGYTRQEASKRDTEVKNRFKDDLVTTYNKDGLEGVIKQFQKDPQRWKRDALGEFVATGMKATGPGSISQTEAEAILNYPITVGGKTVPLGKQFPDLNAIISEGARAARRREVGDYNFAQDQQEREADAELAKIFDEFAVDDDGRIDEEELEVLRERAYSLGRPDSPVLEFAQNNSVNAFTDRAIEAELMKKANNLTLTVDDVMEVKMGANLRNKMLNIARNQTSTRESPIYKTHIKSIKAAISEHPQVKASNTTGTANYSVVLMQDRFVKQYKQNLQRLESPEEALSLTLQQIKTLQETPGAITKTGTYKEIEDEVKNNAEEAGKSLDDYNRLLSQMAKPEFRNDPEFAYNAVGHANFHESYNAMYAGKEAPPMIKNGAELMGVDPLTFINYLASGIGVDPIQPKNTELQEIKASLPPIVRRLYDTYRTNERTTRANAIVSNASSQMPKRSSFAGNDDYLKLRRAIIKQESGGDYQIVNSDSGAIGIGQVMPANVGPWTERYLGKRLTPEEYRFNNAAQDAVINGRFKDMITAQAQAGYSGEVMIRRAAAEWYSGQPDLWDNDKPQYYNGNRYPSIAEYTKSIWNSFQQQ